MKLIVGLGNPGKEYENTKHNVGFSVVKNLAEIPLKMNKKFNAEITTGKIDDEKVVLLCPQTFMNNSGRAVSAAANFYKIKPTDILVIHDDIDLTLGKIRIKKDGSSGGHRGVESIITSLGSENFIRLKIGVAPETKPKNFDAANFVLKKFAKSESKKISEIIKKTTDAVAVVINDGVSRAMNQFN